MLDIVVQECEEGERVRATPDTSTLRSGGATAPHHHTREQQQLHCTVWSLLKLRQLSFFSIVTEGNGGQVKVRRTEDWRRSGVARPIFTSGS